MIGHQTLAATSPAWQASVINNCWQITLPSRVCNEWIVCMQTGLHHFHLWDCSVLWNCVLVFFWLKIKTWGKFVSLEVTSWTFFGTCQARSIGVCLAWRPTSDRSPVGSVKHVTVSLRMEEMQWKRCSFQCRGDQFRTFRRCSLKSQLIVWFDMVKDSGIDTEVLGTTSE